MFSLLSSLFERGELFLCRIALWYMCRLKHNTYMHRLNSRLWLIGQSKGFGDVYVDVRLLRSSDFGVLTFVALLSSELPCIFFSSQSLALPIRNIWQDLKLK